MTRLLLILWLASGLAPGLGEIAESAVHLATAGHLAHSDADHGDLGDQGDEHGCGATHHVCGCCTSLAFAAATATPVTRSAAAPEHRTAAVDALASVHEPAPPSRPPIAS